MNLLYISHLHPPKDAPLDNLGGMQRVSLQLFKELDQMEEVNVYPLILEGRWETVEVRTVMFVTRLLTEVPAIVKNKKIDVILFSSMVTAVLAPLVRKHVDAAMITINHGHDVTWTFGMYQNHVVKIFPALDGVISVSSATRKASIDRGLTGDKGTVLPNGYEDNWIDLLPDKQEALIDLRESLGISKDRKILLTVGRHVKRKGHAWFISEVLPRLKNPVDFLVVGDGPEFDAIEKLSKQIKTESNIYLLGRCSDKFLRTAYAGADLFVMPNVPVKGDMEGFGIVMLEAAVAGTPTIASGLEGIKDVITNGKNGYLIEPLDADAFARKIDNVLNHELEELAVSTQNFVTKNYSWRRVAKAYMDYIKSVVESVQK